MDLENFGVNERRVPGWNGDSQKYLSFRFEQNLFVKAIQRRDRYTCWLLLVRAFGQRPKTIFEMWDGLDSIDEVEINEECIGLDKMYTYN